MSRPGSRLSTGTGTGAAPAPWATREAQARRWTSLTAETDATAWTVVYAGVAEDVRAGDEEGSGAGEDDGPDPAAVPDTGLGDGDDDGPAAGDAAPEPDLRGRPAPRAAVIYTLTGDRVAVEVPALVTGDREVDARLVQLRHQLTLLADQLLALQQPAITAPDLATAHAALVPMTKAQLSGALGLETRTGSFASRHRAMYLRIRAGLVPLDFFSWRPDPRTERVLLTLGELLAQGQQLPEATRRTARRLGAKPDTVRRWAHRVAALLAAPDVVVRARARWPEDRTDEVAAALSLGDRGEAAIRLALVGRLGPALPPPSPRPVRIPIPTPTAPSTRRIR